MKNFLKKFLLLIISASLFLISIDGMYLKALAAPVIDVDHQNLGTAEDAEVTENPESTENIEHSDGAQDASENPDASEEKEQDDSLTNEEDLTIEDIPEELLDFFDKLGYSPEEALEFIKNLQEINEIIREERMEEEQEGDDQEKLLKYISDSANYMDGYTNNNLASDTSLPFKQIISADKTGTDIAADLYAENDIIQSEYINAYVWAIDDLSGLAKNESKIAKMAKEIYSFAEEFDVKTIGVADKQAAEKAITNVGKSTESLAKFGRFLSGVSNFFAICQIESDIKDIFTDNFYNEKLLPRALEGSLVIADMGIGMMSVYIALSAGMVCPPALAVAGLVIGIATAFVHSETFGNAANNADNFWQFLENLILAFGYGKKTPRGVGCYKPNIYIYNALGLDIEVFLLQPELITTSIPEYGNGWEVVAVDNESILKIDENEEYGYLFYESVTNRSLFQTEEGFLIKGKDRKEIFTDLLQRYGFNETEIADFIEFWDSRLDSDKDYLMYPQYTEKVDHAMPICIKPEPQNRTRIWFAFEEYTGQKYRNAQIQPFTHEGYTVVEWGGMVFANN